MCACVCVCVPVGVCVLLQVDQQGGDDLLHVTRLPDVHLQLIIHRLPDDTLKTTDPRHTDPEHTHTHTHTHTHILSFWGCDSQLYFTRKLRLYFKN